MHISVKNLSFTYPNADRKALSDISLSIARGEFVTLCGLSGCGKSTLLRCLKPCLTPRGEISGDVLLDGKPLSSLSEREAARLIGFVGQNPEASIVTDRVWHELAFSLESLGLAPALIRRRTAECAEYFGLERLFESDTAELSGGEKQLVALASAAALRPDVLLLDEPTAQLDPIAARNFFDTAARLCRDFGITIVIAEHRLEELLPVSDRVIVLDGGEVIADCAPRSLLLPKGHRMLCALPAAVRISAAAGITENIPLSVREGRADPRIAAYLKENAPTAPEKKPQGEPVLTAKELWVSYGKGQPDALKCASLALFGGEVYALMGGNGSGKSTLLKALCGIVKPLGGRVKTSRGARLAYLPQEPAALFGEESALLELTSRKLSEQDARALLSRFGLGEQAGQNPLDLSGGEQQRLALAVLLGAKPDILLLDEPTKGMDAASKQELSALLKAVCAEGAAALLVTHDAEFAALCADRCGLLFNGEVLCEGAPHEFFRDNLFYTTPLARLSEGIAENWV